MQKPRPILALMERTLRLLDRARPGNRTRAQRRDAEGERAAYFYLRRLGFTVVARRWQHASAEGEADFIAWEGETLCFIEVKTRESRSSIAAEASIDKSKRDTLRALARTYVRQLPWPHGDPADLQTRFDVLTVYLTPGERPDIRLTRNFFS